MCVCVSNCVYHLYVGVCRGQKKISESLKREQQAVLRHLMWMMGNGALCPLYLLLAAEAHEHRASSWFKTSSLWSCWLWSLR